MMIRIPGHLCADDDRRSRLPSLTINMKILDVPQSGRSGTMVSYKTRYGQFRRSYVIPRDPSTPIQVVRRKAMGHARFLWRTLTDQQYAAWKATAHGARTRRRMNQSGALSPYLLFIKINCNLAVVGLPMVLDPTAAPQFGPNPVRQLIITNTNGAIAIKLSVSGKLPQYIVVRATKPRSAGVSYVDHFTILGVLPAPVRGVSDITDLYVGKYGVPSPGSRVFIQTFQVIDGWDDLPEQISAIVPAA
jgi:hypothetical protein